MTYKAIVIGATGAVGTALVRELLASDQCTGVVIALRRAVDTFGTPEKLTTTLVDMDHLERDITAAAAGCDAAFCTMGVGQPTKVPKDELWRVDVEYAAAFARGCRAAGVRSISLLSSVGAKLGAKAHYFHVKGSAEKAVTDPGFDRVSLFRPSVIATPEARYGTGDRILQWTMPKMSWMLPKRLHEVRVDELARAMRLNAERPASAKIEVLHYSDFVAPSA